MKLVFMGTPDFSVPVLEALLKAGHTVTGVFTQPDKPKGRSLALAQPPVKRCAVQHGLPVFQPPTLRDEQALAQFRRCEPDAAVVAAYGKILPRAWLEAPRLGCLNVHASLLPSLRGASPIQWAILSGLEQTGVTIMQMDEGMDTGAILAQAALPVGPQQTADGLHDALAELGARLIVSTLQALERGTLTPVEQDGAQATYAPLIRREMGKLDFTKPAAALERQIRAFTPWPGAYFYWNGRRLKVLEARVGEAVQAEAGRLLPGEDGIRLACGKGTSLVLTLVQPEGKSRMSAAAFLRGHPPTADFRTE